jgi:hypothetical protein
MVHDQHLQNVRTLVVLSKDPLQRLHTLLAKHAAFVCRNLDQSTVLSREMDKLPEARRIEILGANQDYQRTFRDAIFEAQQAGHVAPDVNPKLAALWILGSLNWLHRWYRPDRDRDPDEIAKQFADQLTRGITVSPLLSTINHFALKVALTSIYAIKSHSGQWLLGSAPDGAGAPRQPDALIG